jgi:hypothetical protein
MRYAVELDSGDMIYVPGFMKIGSGFKKLIRGVDRRHGDLRSLLLFFQT